MKLAKDEDLRTFIENYSLNDNAFKLAFVDFITKKYIKPDKKKQKDYIKEISNIFSSATGNGKSRYSYRYDYDDDSGWMSIACDMQKLFDEAEIMLKAGDFVTPIIIVMNFFKTAAEYADDGVYYDDEGQYEMRECCEKAGELIMKIVSNPSVDVKQKRDIFRDISKIENDDVIFSYFEYDVEDLMFEVGALVQSPEERITMLDDKIKEQEGKGYRVYNYVTMKINYLNELRRYDEAQSVMDDYMHLPEIRKMKVDTLQNLGKYEEALKLLDDGIVIAKQNNRLGTVEDWLEMKLKIYESLKSEKDIIDICRTLFIAKNGSLEHYEKLKKYVPSAEWNMFLHKMISEVRYKYYEVIADIYEKEKDHDELFKWIVSNQSDRVGHILDYGFRMPSSYHQSLLELFAFDIKNYATKKENMSRNNYKEIAQRLREAKRLAGGETAVAKIVDEFRNIYKRRPAMMEELNDL